MKSLSKKIFAATVSGVSTLALAGGDSGTQSMSEMNITGAQFGMLVGALVGLGIVIWLVVKLMNK